MNAVADPKYLATRFGLSELLAVGRQTGLGCAMPLFYFHLQTRSELRPDETGLELESVEAAYLAAYHAVPGMAAELAREGLDPFQFKFVITNEKDCYLMTLPFSEALGLNGR